MTLGAKWAQEAQKQQKQANKTIGHLSGYLPAELVGLSAGYLTPHVGSPNLCTCADSIDSTAMISGCLATYCPAHGHGQMIFSRHDEPVYPRFCYRDVCLFGIWASEADRSKK